LLAAGLIRVYCMLSPSHRRCFALLFSCMVWRIRPGAVAITLALLAFHYYLVPQSIHIAWKDNLFVVGISEVPRLILFSFTSLFGCIPDFGAEKKQQKLSGVRAMTCKWRLGIKSGLNLALLRSEMYLTEAQRLDRTGSFGWNVSSGESSGQTNLPNLPM